jgi:hypothetical protein
MAADKTQALPEAPGKPGGPIVGWLAPDGTITVVDCAVCPWRQKLCDSCVIPELEATGLADYGPGAEAPTDFT